VALALVCQSYINRLIIASRSLKLLLEIHPLFFKRVSERKNMPGVGISFRDFGGKTNLLACEYIDILGY
jgi:hypothetical protein